MEHEFEFFENQNKSVKKCMRNASTHYVRVGTGTTPIEKD
jgi:hypothetical protein